MQGAVHQIYSKGLRMIVSDQLKLTAFDERHLENVRRWVNDPVTAGLLDRAFPVSDAEHQKWYSNVIQRQDCVFFAIETNEGEHVGNVWLWNIDWRHRKAELRILVGSSEQQGRGLGAKAIELACEFAFRRLNLHRIYAFVLANNPRAKRAFEKAGFKQEGVLIDDRWSNGAYIDSFILAITD